MRTWVKVSKARLLRDCLHAEPAKNILSLLVDFINSCPKLFRPNLVRRFLIFGFATDHVDLLGLDNAIPLGLGLFAQTIFGDVSKATPLGIHALDKSTKVLRPAIAKWQWVQGEGGEWVRGHLDGRSTMSRSQLMQRS